MNSQVPISIPTADHTRWPVAAVRPTPGSVAVGLSIALHVIAAACALSMDRVAPRVAVVETVQRVRTIYRDITLPHPPPPTRVLPAPPSARVVPRETVARKAPPAPRRRKRRKRRKPAKTTPRPAPQPAAFARPAAPAAPPPPSPAQMAPAQMAPAVPVKVTSAGAGVAVDASGPAASEGQGEGPVDPRAGDVNGAVHGAGVNLSAYGARVRAAVQRRQHYPERAEEDGLEGTVRVRVTVRTDGTLAAPPRVLRSSGHRTLDAEAVRMVRASAPFTRLPSGFAAGIAELTIPIVFELEDDDF